MADNEDDESINKFDHPRNKAELEKYFKKTYKFTQKEKQMLGQCYDEAFNTRGIPFGIGLAVIIDVGIRRGYIKPLRTLGPLSTALIGGTCGIFLGVFSATNLCYDKLRQSPDSMYGRYLQNKQFGIYDFDYEPTRLRADDESASTSVNDRFAQPNVLNLDFERPDVKDSNEFRRFPNDDSVEDMQDVEHSKPSVSYEQLRKKNRDAYAKTTEFKYDRITGDVGPDSMQRILRAEPLSEENTEEHDSVEKNKYGDLWPT